MTLSKKTVIKALEGVVLFRNPVLWEDNGRPTADHRMAIQSVIEDISTFRQVAEDELKHFPNTDQFIGHLILERLLQDDPLSSPIIQKLFPVGPIEFEDALSGIRDIPNIQTISSNVHAPKGKDKGDDTDEIIRDVWAEFFVADFLVRIFNPTYIEKIIRAKSQPVVEFYVQQGREEWIVEVARLRKKDFEGETMPWGGKDCAKKENTDRIQKVLQSKLDDKNVQMQKFINNEKRNFGLAPI